MISPHVAKFLAAVGEFFPPSSRDPEAAERWAIALDRALCHVEPRTLARAAELIVTTRDPKKDGRFFPLPSECIEACKRAGNEIKAAETPLIAHGHRDQSPWAGWRIDRADELIRTTAMGREAAAGGWTLALHDFIRANQRLPNDLEVGRVRASASETKELVEMCERGEAGPLSGPLARLGRTILERGKDMAAYVGGKGEATWRR